MLSGGQLEESVDGGGSSVVHRLDRACIFRSCKSREGQEEIELWQRRRRHERRRMSVLLGEWRHARGEKALKLAARPIAATALVARTALVPAR